MKKTIKISLTFSVFFYLPSFTTYVIYGTAPVEYAIKIKRINQKNFTLIAIAFFFVCLFFNPITLCVYVHMHTISHNDHLQPCTKLFFCTFIYRLFALCMCILILYHGWVRRRKNISKTKFC